MKRDFFTRIFTSAIVMAIAITAIHGVAGYCQEVDPPVRFAIISDRTGGHVPGVYGQIVVEVERLKPDFVMTVGDMIEGYVDDTVRIHQEWDEYDSLITPLSMPIYFTPGNHDIWSDLSEELYRNRIGKPYYSFDHKSLHFVILNNSRTDSSVELSSEQIDWLINDLKQHETAAYTFVFYHKPFWYHTTAENKPDTLHSLLAKFGVDAVFTGHYHDYFCGVYDGVIYTSFGSSGGGADPSPTDLLYHFAWITVDNKGIHIAPIKMGAVLPWDEITAAERKTFNPLRRMGLAFENSLPVNDDLKVVKAEVTVVLDNTYSDYELNDTIRWDVPLGWTVEPQIMPVMVAPDEKKSFHFDVACHGDLYPVPTAEVVFTYAEGKTVTANAGVNVARKAFCYPAVSKPVIDGEISEDCWQNPITYFFAPGGGDMAIDPARFYFAYDEDNLYLAALCNDSKMDSLKASVTEHDGAIYGEDCVGYFFAPIMESDTLYQIYLNPLGTAYDAKYWKGEDGYLDGSRDWNGNYEVKTIKTGDFWSIEARIPLDQFGVKANEGDKWGLNFRRKQRRFNSAADWQTPIEFDAATFGVLIMR